MKQISGAALIVFLLLKGAIILYIVEQIFGGDIDALIMSMRNKPVRLAFFFMVLYVIGGLVLFPTSVIVTAMAFTYVHMMGTTEGVIFTFIWNYICINLAATLQFLLGRYLFGDFLYSRAIQSRYFFALDRSIKTDGAWILFLLRSSTLVPCSMLTYACAVTDMSLRQFYIGNTAWLPVCLIYIFLGSSAAHVQKGFKEGQVPTSDIVLTVVAALCMITVIILIGRKVKKILEEVAGPI